MKSPWVLKLEEEIRYFEKNIMQEYGSMFRTLNKYSKNKIIKSAVAHKKYDIYHSTTIEGYAITPDEVEAVISGRGCGDRESAEQLKNKMAIIGHSEAFEYVMDRIKADFSKPRISEELITEIYFRLFKPSVDAGMINKFDLMGYRNVKVFIRKSRFVPPSYEKVPELMSAFTSSMNKVENNILRAILAHYFFVSIHPYPDGNGRCARLLMNYLLAATGLHWITITADKKTDYFQALQSGQIDGNILPFAKFIANYLNREPPAK